jgi:hypothetical protein
VARWIAAAPTRFRRRDSPAAYPAGLAQPLSCFAWSIRQESGEVKSGGWMARREEGAILDMTAPAARLVSRRHQALCLVSQARSAWDRLLNTRRTKVQGETEGTADRRVGARTGPGTAAAPGVHSDRLWPLAERTWKL